MNALFNPNGPFMRIMGRVFDLIVLNMLFLICSIPIVTIGPAYAALQKVTQSLVLGTGSEVLKPFFAAFRENCKQAVILWLVALVVIAIWVYNAMLVFSYFTGTLAILCYLILGLAAAVVAAILGYYFPLMVRYDDTLYRHLLNATILTVLKFPKTVLMVLLAALPVLMMSLLLNAILPYWILGGFSVYSYCVSILMKPVFRELEENKTE